MIEAGFSRSLFSMSPFAKKPSKKIYILLLTLCVIPCGCMVKYNPTKPKLPESNSWKTKSQQTDNPLAKPEETSYYNTSVSKWWTIFDDPLLTKYEEEGLLANPTVQISLTRVQESEAQLGIVRSEQFPALNLFTGYSRQRVSKSIQQNQISSFQSGGAAGPSTSSTSANSSTKTTTTSPPLLPGGKPTKTTTIANTKTNSTTTVTPATPTQPKIITHFTTLQVLPEFSYEVDLWGRYSQQTKAAQEQLYAQEYDLKASLLTLTTDIANAYFNICTLDDQIDVLERTIKTRKTSYDLNKAQFDSGIINALNVALANVEYTQAQADLEDAKRQRTVYENALAILLGKVPSEFQCPKTTLPKNLPVIPPVFSAEVIRQRPDLCALERLIESNRWSVGVAKTNFFPALTLGGSYGYESNRTSSLFKWKNHVWSFTADALTPIFNGFLNVSQYELAVAQYKDALAQYINAIFTSFQEVDDSLVNLQQRQKSQKFLSEKLVSSKEALRIATLRYKMGVIDYFDVINEETTELQTELNVIQIQNLRIFDTIALIKSMGGTWNTGTEPKETQEVEKLPPFPIS